MNIEVQKFLSQREVDYSYKVFLIVCDYIIFCYKKLLSEKKVYSKKYILEYTNIQEENYYRDRLLYDFIHKCKEEYKEKYQVNYNAISNFLFLAEVQTLYDKDKSSSRSDIFIVNLHNNLLGSRPPEQVYFEFECKKLGNNALNTKYINEGIKRFLSRNYETLFNFTGMIGFILENEVKQIVSYINEKLNKENENLRTIEYLSNFPLNDYFSDSYYSKHEDLNNDSLIFLHLLLDFRKIAIN